MLENGSLVLVYPYNTKELSEDQKLRIPHYYRHGEGDLMTYYMEGTVTDDNGVEFTVTRTDDGGPFISQWEDIYKVVVKLDAEGKVPTKAGRTQYAPGRSQPDVESSDDAAEHYGGDSSTDKIRKDGMGTYVILGICAVGVVLYMKRW